VAQDLWVVLSTKEFEDEINRRFNLVRTDSPADFQILALARHKVAFEWREYERERDNFERLQASLDRRSRGILTSQRYHRRALGQLRSVESSEFEGKLASCMNNLADYRQIAGRVKELKNTLDVNRAIFLVRAPALMSAAGREQVLSAERQESAAESFLQSYDQDDIFRPELARMEGHCRQLEFDIRYSDLMVERVEASLRTGAERLSLAGNRVLTEISQLHSVEASAVVGSLAGVVTVELLRIAGTIEAEPAVAANAVLLSVSGAFAITQVLSNLGSIKTSLERNSFALAVGLLAGFILALGWADNSVRFALLNSSVAVAGAALGWLLYRTREMQLRTLRRRRRQSRANVLATLANVLYVSEELEDLLEDLPPASARRMKLGPAGVEKVERRNGEEAAKRGMTVEQFRELGLGWTAKDVKVIGVCYVVAPWRVADLVDRIRAVRRPLAVEYRNVTTGLKRGSEVSQGVAPEVDEQGYQGKYGGFSLNHKAIHIDLDLWGVGAGRDANLLAEIQVRTPLQNALGWLHDIMCKGRPRPRRGKVATWRRGRRLRRARARWASAPWLIRAFDHWCPWLNRPLARLFTWLTDLELRLFGSMMEWRDEGRS
jgi:hypothetical protein